MRLFYAITFTPETKRQINTYKERLRKCSLKGKFTATSNFHLTLEFIGEVDKKEVEKYKKVIKKLPTQKAKLSTTSLGKFKSKGGDIFWIGLRNNRDLSNLVSQLVRELEVLDHTPIFDHYTPHITLGRGIQLDREISPDFIKPFDLQLDSIALMESRREEKRLIYKPVYEVKFIG